jgi:hypothetical protein
VGVAVEGELNACVPCKMLDEFGVHTSAEKQREARVPEIVPMVHHVPRFLARNLESGREEKAALVVVDDLALDQWVVLREALAEQLDVRRRRRLRLGSDHNSSLAPGYIRRQSARVLPLQHRNDQ